MGDDLPELLYRAFVNGMGLSYGSDETPSWHNLSATGREAWGQVAAKARNEMLDRVFGALDSVELAEYEDVGHELRARFGR